MKTKEWMIVIQNKSMILLHLNSDLPQYKNLKRVDKKKLEELLK